LCEVQSQTCRLVPEGYFASVEEQHVRQMGS
jgi:hypothetical protein